MEDFLDLLQLLFLLVVLVLVLPVLMALNWAVLGAFGFFVFFLRKGNTEPQWWHFPAIVCWMLVYWLVCKKFGMLGLVIPAIMHALQAA